MVSSSTAEDMTDFMVLHLVKIGILGAGVGAVAGEDGLLGANVGVVAGEGGLLLR